MNKALIISIMQVLLLHCGMNARHSQATETKQAHANVEQDDQDEIMSKSVDQPAQNKIAEVKRTPMRSLGHHLLLLHIPPATFLSCHSFRRCILA